jgi:hypothetical protein
VLGSAPQGGRADRAATGLDCWVGRLEDGAQAVAAAVGVREGQVSERSLGPDRDLYRLLGVEPTVDAAALARAYRCRLRQLHPDTAAAADDAQGDGDEAEQAAAHRVVEMAAVQRAYQVLRDPRRRDRYDAEQASIAAAYTDHSAGTAGSGLCGAPCQAVPITVRVRAAPRREHFLIRVGPVRMEPPPPR